MTPALIELIKLITPMLIEPIKLMTPKNFLYS